MFLNKNFEFILKLTVIQIKVQRSNCRVKIIVVFLNVWLQAGNTFFGVHLFDSCHLIYTKFGLQRFLEDLAEVYNKA